MNKTIISILFIFILFISSCRKNTINITTDFPNYLDNICNKNMEIGVVVDIDGNPYKTIEVGGKHYTIDYLKTSRYNDGSSIAKIEDSILWKNDTIGAWCFYENERDSIVNGYSIKQKLYNWYAINSGKLCPNGWHVMTDQESTEFTIIVTLNQPKYTPCINSSVAEYGLGWRKADGSFTLSSGDYDSNYDLFGATWTATSIDDSLAWSRKQDLYQRINLRASENKHAGMNCLCVKD